MANENILKKHGVRAKIARELGIHHSAPYQWQEVPADRLISVARILSVHPSELRPDLYPLDALTPPIPACSPRAGDPAPAVSSPCAAGVRDSDFASTQHMGD